MAIDEDLEMLLMKVKTFQNIDDVFNDYLNDEWLDIFNISKASVTSIIKKKSGYEKKLSDKILRRVRRRIRELQKDWMSHREISSFLNFSDHKHVNYILSATYIGRKILEDFEFRV